MSHKVTNLVYSRKVGSLIRKAVLAYMADIANHDGTGVWPSKRRVADEIEASQRGVITAIKSMVDDGILVVIGKRPCPNGYTMEYAIALDVVAELPLMPHHEDDPCKSAPVHEVHVTHAPSSPDPCTQFTQTTLNHPKPSKADALESAPAKKRATRLPEDWRPDPQDDIASKEGLTHEQAERELDKFRDYWAAQPGAKGRKLDWEATWRNWVRRAGERGASGPAGRYHRQNTQGQPAKESLTSVGLRLVAESRGLV